MSDADLRALERASTLDPLERYRYRCELVRLGRAAEAGFVVGDRVLVRENEGNRWFIGPWEAIVSAPPPGESNNYYDRFFVRPLLMMEEKHARRSGWAQMVEHDLGQLHVIVGGRIIDVVTLLEPASPT